MIEDRDQFDELACGRVPDGSASTLPGFIPGINAVARAVFHHELGGFVKQPTTALRKRWSRGR
jgi:hypothetical protein